jgi:YegS/Rv2252/BmrU family lipid kinase
MSVDIQQKPKTYVVINPVAGVSQPEVVREKIESALHARDIPYELYETTAGENLQQKIRDAIDQGFKLFMVAGGDGTLSSVIDGLADTSIPLVIIPTGTWNALARVLDIPLQLDEAVELLFQEHAVQTIDAMQIDKHFCVLSISIGIGSLTVKNVKREEKRRFGKLADLWTGVAQLMEFQSYPFHVKIDGQPITFRASELLVANTSTLVLKPLQLDPNIRMDDGKLNVCRIYANSLAEYLRLAASMLRGDQQHNWSILCMEALQEVEIDCREKLPVQGDGDVLGTLPVTITIHPGAVHIVTPLPSQT